jgi:hypothetical protein
MLRDASKVANRRGAGNHARLRQCAADGVAARERSRRPPVPPTLPRRTPEFSREDGASPASSAAIRAFGPLLIATGTEATLSSPRWWPTAGPSERRAPAVERATTV